MRPMSRRALPAAAAVLVLAFSACGSGDNSAHGSMPSGGDAAGSTSAGTAAGADADVVFAQMMIPHHEQAVEMASMAIANDTASEEVKALARRIEAAQDPEIQTMRGWLRTWGAVESAGPMHHGSGGMMTDEDMASLEGATGAEFDRMWLTMMIEHHRGAVDMAQDVLATTADADVEELATAVVESQEKEIATMRGMLG